MLESINVELHFHISRHIRYNDQTTLGKQKFLHRMGAQVVTSQKALDNSWVQDGSLQ